MFYNIYFSKRMVEEIYSSVLAPTARYCYGETPSGRVHALIRHNYLVSDEGPGLVMMCKASVLIMGNVRPVNSNNI